MTQLDHQDRMFELAARISRNDAIRLCPLVHAVCRKETLGNVAELLREASFALWEALDPDNTADTLTLRELLCQHRYALQAAAAALELEAAWLSHEDAVGGQR